MKIEIHDWFEFFRFLDMYGKHIIIGYIAILIIIAIMMKSCEPSYKDFKKELDEVLMENKKS